jgi:hypothetical protein
MWIRDTGCYSVHLLAVVVIIASSSNCDLLGVPLLPLLTAFGASISTFAGSLEWSPLAAVRDHLPIALDKDDPDHLFTSGVLGGNVKQLLCVLWLITIEFMH